MKIDDIITSGTSPHYCVTNADGKVWLFDKQHLRLSMMLYQPSGWRGIALKRLLPYVHRLKPLRDKLRIETVNCWLDQGLCAVLPEHTDFAVFSGTPCVHQKLTIQLSSGDRILAYAKVSDSADIAHLFDRETQLLRLLAECGVDGIPSPIYCGQYMPGKWAFVQSTAKDLHSTQINGWSQLTDDFMDKLERLTSHNARFEDTDFYTSLNALREHIAWLPDECRQTTRQALETVYTDLSGKTVTCSAYHGDFTPWNMFVSDGRLFVFDWEYGSMSYPPGLDRYHFFTQTAIYERHLSAQDIISEIKNLHWIDPIKYIYYILDITSRFTLREKGNPDKNILSDLLTWNEILKYLTTWTK